MKQVYPIVLTQGKDYVVVYVPDFEINTQGTDIADAIEMARDAIGLMGIDREDDKKPLPQPTAASLVAKENDDDIVTLVDVDFTAYRASIETRAVKKNCTIPSWLNDRATRQNVNFSAALQRGLMQELHIDNRP